MLVRTEVGEIEVGTEECFQRLIAELEDPDPRVRRVAVCGLAASGHPRAVEHIIRALRDPDVAVRERAAVALGRIGDRRAAPALAEAAVREDDPAVHRAALLSLGELGPVALEVLVRELHCREVADRICAAIALGETRDIAAAEPLVEALKDEDETVRIRAREALEKIRESPVF
jgi:HEAT repeat protein